MFAVDRSSWYIIPLPSPFFLKRGSNITDKERHCNPHNKKISIVCVFCHMGSCKSYRMYSLPAVRCRLKWKLRKLSLMKACGKSSLPSVKYFTAHLLCLWKPLYHRWICLSKVFYVIISHFYHIFNFFHIYEKSMKRFTYRRFIVYNISEIPASLFCQAAEPTDRQDVIKWR